jgi:hypothetical protein
MKSLKKETVHWIFMGYYYAGRSRKNWRTLTVTVDTWISNDGLIL